MNGGCSNWSVRKKVIDSYVFFSEAQLGSNDLISSEKFELLSALEKCFIRSNELLNFYFRMPWQGQKENLIDRFDVRAHLDIIPEITRRDSEDEDLDRDQLRELRDTNYERYRILIQNDFLKSKRCEF